MTKPPRSSQALSQSSPSVRASRVWLGVGLAAVLLGGGVWTLSAADGRDTEPKTDAKPQQRGAFSGARFGTLRADQAACSFAEGSRMAYAIRSRTSVELDMSEVARQVDVGGAPQAAVQVSEATRRDIERDWVLELEAVATQRDEQGSSSVLAARIQDRGIRSLGSGPTPSPAKSLGETFLIRVDARCSIREFGWRSEGSLEGAREQQLLAAGLGFWAPADMGEATSYGAASWDMSGSYKTSYSYKEDGRIHGEVVSFAVPQTLVNVMSSAIEVQLEPGLWFASLHNERDLEMSFHGVDFGTHFRSTTARATELGDFDPIVDLDDGGWSWGRLGAAPTSEVNKFDPALRQLAFEDAMLRYRELVASGTISQYGGLLRDWLRANPEQSERVLAQLRAGAFDDDQKGRGGLFYALGSAGTPEANEVLVGLLRSEDDRIMHQVAAAHAISMNAEPSESMLDALREASSREDLHEIERGSMALALGTFAASSGDQDPELAAAAREEIAAWLSNPAPSEGAVTLNQSLLAAGNTGHDELAPSIGSYLDHEDAKIRRSAAHAMRGMSPEAAFPALEHSAGDEDRVVRTAALEAALEVARAHDQSPSEAIRDLAADALTSEHAAERAAAVRLLDQAAKRGDAQAQQALQGELRYQLEQVEEGGDTRQLALLGRGMSGSWKAD